MAFGKLAAFRLSHPHLLVLPKDEPEGDAAPWADVGVDEPPAPKPAWPSAHDRARFMDVDNWSETGDVSNKVWQAHLDYGGIDDEPGASELT